MARTGFVMGAAAGLILLSATAWLASPLQGGETAGPVQSAGSAEKALTVTGIVIRDEQAVYAPEGEYTLALAAEGGRVAAGGAVIAAANTHEGLMCAARDCARNDAGVARELARRAVYAAAAGREELAEPLAALYEPAVDEPYVLATAERSAVWCAHSDGLEYLSPDVLNEVNAGTLHDMFSLEPVNNGAAGKLVSSNIWYFAAILPASQSALEGSEALLRFEDFEATARVSFAGGAESGERAVVFAVNEDLTRALDLRVCEAQVVMKAD